MAQMFRPVPVEQEPKRKNRFTLEFPTELGIESVLVQTSGKPKVSINSVAINYMNTVRYVAGIYKFETIDIEFIDVIGPSTSQKIWEWLSLHIEPATGKMGYAVGYKKNLVLKGVDPLGVDIEKWNLLGCFITSADFESYDYASDDIMKCKITIQPDVCLLSA
jgi:hypothetical protein